MFVPLDHPRFHRAQRDIFLRKVTPDCMSHQCRKLQEENALQLDACCQYGADVDIAERDAILARADEIGALLSDEARDRPWFDQEVYTDADFPSAAYVRTATYGVGCIFLAHDRRGCAIHRASLEGGWDFHGTKPHVCRLFPVTYDEDSIVVADDYADYSCALDAAAPTLYQVARMDLGQIFGPELVRALDAAEREVLGPRARLRVVAP